MTLYQLLVAMNTSMARLDPAKRPAIAQTRHEQAKIRAREMVADMPADFTTRLFSEHWEVSKETARPVLVRAVEMGLLVRVSPSEWHRTEGGEIEQAA